MVAGIPTDTTEQHNADVRAQQLARPLPQEKMIMTRAIHPTATARASGSRLRLARKVALPVLVTTGMVLLTMGNQASAGIVPTVGLGTAANYSVLGATTVTNTNLSVLAQSVGLSPGTSITGFPPGIVLGSATIASTNPVTVQAQSDLTTAYLDAKGRSVEFLQTNPDLVGQTLIPGVYAAAAKAPLGLSGQLVLDGQNNPNAVFIFQTDSTLITSTGSTIELINGASECNVYWQVGSSATLATGSVFVGNILALTSITVQNSVVVHGRALAQTGAVTLDNDVFTAPSCVPTTATTAPATTTTIAGSATSTTVAGSATTVAGSATTVAGSATTTPAGVTVATSPEFNVTDLTLPRTGTGVGTTSRLGSAALVLGGFALVLTRRRRLTGSKDKVS
jgi:type VI secretion system secreted protein VgrG